MRTTMNRMHDLRKSERGENDGASSGSVGGGSAHSTLDTGAPERRRERVQGAFLEGLSGRDPLRVIRAGVANGGHDWLPYEWAR
jgi:hypothetical protein